MTTQPARILPFLLAMLLLFAGCSSSTTSTSVVSGGGSSGTTSPAAPTATSQPQLHGPLVASNTTCLSLLSETEANQYMGFSAASTIDAIGVGTGTHAGIDCDYFESTPNDFSMIVGPLSAPLASLADIKAGAQSDPHIQGKTFADTTVNGIPAFTEVGSMTVQAQPPITMYYYDIIVAKDGYWLSFLDAGKISDSTALNKLKQIAEIVLGRV